MDADLKGWVDSDIDDGSYAGLVADANRTLTPYLRPDGSTDLALPAAVGVAVER